ncbi:hypothetical protein [Nocardia sp. BMG111209]|uniref:hypothetical protein n=1 Tax=Nocardia sp. BMG111209 TaxID=1160137 RepID=UPI00035DC669|nr:hypothetical protein [Nocardia sp. BMG111209]
MTASIDSLVELFTGPAADENDYAALYAALRRVQAGLGDRPLLADHDTLRAVLELSAVTDPRLFHVMFLHHCMTIGNALDQGADPADVAALASAECVGAALMTEKGRGNSSSGVRTEAVYDPAAGTFVLRTPDADAAKHPINVGADGIARLGVVSARLRVGGVDRGTALFLVALRDEHGPLPGVVIESRSRTALLPVDYATVRFEEVRVPYSRWLRDGAAIAADGAFHDPLGGPDERTRRSVSMSRFSWGAVTTGVGAVARAAVARAITHARVRRTLDRFGGERLALEHLNQQRLLSVAAAGALAATTIARRTTAESWRVSPGDGTGPGLSGADMRRLSLHKVTAVTLADAAVARSRSSAGAPGFFSDNRFVDFQALTTAFATAGGDNRLILIDAAWSIVNGVEYAAPQPDSWPDEWAGLLWRREDLLRTELVHRLADTGGGAAIMFDNWNRHTELAQRLGEAHAGGLTARILREEWLGATVSGPRRDVLADLYELHCLEEVSGHAGWYLAHDLLGAADVLGLPDRGAEICRRVAARADTVLELLDIPAPLVGGTH